MLNFRAFKEELHALLSNVLHDAEKLQDTAEDPVVLDRAWILDRMKNQMLESEYVLEPGATLIRQGLGDLFKLPQELREMIYSRAIASGSMDILRASRQTYKEANPIVPEEGIYRLVLGFPDDVPNVEPDDSSSRKIQNVSVRVNARGFFSEEDGKDLTMLCTLESTFLTRKKCLVTFECDPFSGDLCAYGVVPALKGLTNFERVTLKLDFDWMGEPWPDRIPWFEKERVEGRIDRAFLFQRRVLEPTLGTGDLNLDFEDQSLTFYPLQQDMRRQVEEIGLESDRGDTASEH